MAFPRARLQAERDALAARLQQAEAAREALAAEREGLDGKLSWSEQQAAALQVRGGWGGGAAGRHPGVHARPLPALQAVAPVVGPH